MTFRTLPALICIRIGCTWTGAALILFRLAMSAFGWTLMKQQKRRESLYLIILTGRQ